MLYNWLKSYDQSVETTIQLLKRLKIKVTQTTVNETIVNHPDFPSLLSISDALHQWHVENVAVKVEKNKLSELPCPFIAHVSGFEKETFLLITQVKEEQIVTLNGDGKVKVENKAKFLLAWDGVVLFARSIEDSGEDDYEKKRRKEIIESLRLPAIVFIGITIASLLTWQYTTIYENNSAYVWAFSLFLFIKLIGVFVSFLLLWYEIDKANPTLQKICSFGKVTNCHAILSSRHAKIFGWLTWSEIGFYYFAGGLFLLFIQPAVKSLQMLVALNVISLPYILFSVFYQWKIAKQWCMLCISIQVLLLLELVTSVNAGLLTHLTIKSAQPINWIISFALPVIIWNLFKPSLLEAEENKRQKKDLMRIKYNWGVFENLLSKQKQVKFETGNLGIVLGTPSANNTLIKVCNPYCGPCSRAHQEIDKLLSKHKNLKIQIIFTATNNDQDERALPAKHLLSISAVQDEVYTKRALNEWYTVGHKNYSAFAAKYPIEGGLRIQNQAIEEMAQWCEKVGITFTPTFFLNGRQLPEGYTIADIDYFIT